MSAELQYPDWDYRLGLVSVAPPPGRQPRDAANLHSRSVLRQDALEIGRLGLVDESDFGDMGGVSKQAIGGYDTAGAQSCSNRCGQRLVL
ncbi:unnamed protein product [Symbiodinium sp. KB8]|nr:unnamed protein product [Symbiodinium sp. KB8]